MADFTRTQSSNLEQSTASLYNEAVKFRKAGLQDDAENKFRAALGRNKRHVSRLPISFSRSPSLVNGYLCGTE